MTPYTNIYYFIALVFLFIPILIAGFREKKLPVYSFVLTLFLLSSIYLSSLAEFLSFVCYILWQIGMVNGYHVYRKNKNAAGIFYLLIFLALLPLLLVKVIPFFEIHTTIGFLGISYLTFKSVQVLIDLRDGTLKDYRSVDFISFLLFYPTISSGPIDRFKRFKQDMTSIPTKEEYRLLVFQGTNKIFLGFLYKFIIASFLNANVIQTLYVQEHSFLPTVIYMYAYSLYLFFDFAGYSCFAIGVSYYLGIKTPENFHLPFLSRNIKDFWNRWHMSLSFWFRDYVYMRFVFLFTKKKWIKNRYTVSYLGYFVLFLLMGLWHGLALHYIVYGLYHAGLIIGFDVFDRWNKKHKKWKKTKWTYPISLLITFHVICFGFLLFSGRLF